MNNDMNNETLTPDVTLFIAGMLGGLVVLALGGFYYYAVFIDPETMPAADAGYPSPQAIPSSYPVAYTDADQYAQQQEAQTQLQPQQQLSPQQQSEGGNIDGLNIVGEEASSSAASQTLDEVYDSSRISLIGTVHSELAAYQIRFKRYPPDLPTMGSMLHLPAVFMIDPQTKGFFPYEAAVDGKSYVLGVRLAQPSTKLVNESPGELDGNKCGEDAYYCITP